MLGRRIAARQPPPTCLPELRRALLDEWCNIPQDQIYNLVLSMPRRLNDPQTLLFLSIAGTDFGDEGPPHTSYLCQSPPDGMVGKLEGVTAQMPPWSVERGAKLRVPSLLPLSCFRERN
ncbi:transposable element Tcb1 transposase [Trichonephila clavipes]|nr:transposable element Tcb1 transposase [Trichonephila clavipes]